MCRQDSTSKPLVIPLYVICVQLFVLRASSRCKQDVGALSWLNAETVERVLTPVFGSLVRCSAHRSFFGRLRYYHTPRCANSPKQFNFLFLVLDLDIVTVMSILVKSKKKRSVHSYHQVLRVQVLISQGEEE